MRVAHLFQSFSPTTETFTYNIVRELERQDVDNRVLTFRRVNEEERPFPKVTVIDRPNRWHPRRLWYRFLVLFGSGQARTSDWAQTRERLASAIEHVRPDVLHAHFGPAGVLVAPVARELGIPLLVSFYGYDVSQVLEEAFWRRKYNVLWEMVDVSIVLSREMRNRLVQAACPVEKVEIVHLSSDFENLHFCRPSRPVQRLLFVGRLVEKKAPLDAVRAVDRVVSQGEDLSLHIVGDGGLRNEVSQYVATHDLDEHVTLHGALPHEDVLHQMEKADAFVLPSKTASTGDREGTPTVLVEAQASGLPCIATEHAGIPEMIPEANQDLLLPEGDPDALADRLRKLMALSVEELGKIAERGRGKVEADFCLSSEVEKLKNIYRDVIQ